MNFVWLGTWRIGRSGEPKSLFVLLCQPLLIKFIPLIKLATPWSNLLWSPQFIIKNGLNVKDYWWFWEKKNPIIPWNSIWDAHAQKGTKRKFSRGSLQRMMSRSARHCKFHISTIKAALVAGALPPLFALLSMVCVVDNVHPWWHWWSHWLPLITLIKGCTPLIIHP